MVKREQCRLQSNRIPRKYGACIFDIGAHEKLHVQNVVCMHTHVKHCEFTLLLKLSQLLRKKNDQGFAALISSRLLKYLYRHDFHVSAFCQHLQQKRMASTRAAALCLGIRLNTERSRYHGHPYARSSRPSIVLMQARSACV